MRMRVLLTSVLVPVLVIGTAITGGFFASGRTADTRSSLTAALDSLPVDTQVSGFTDWALIRKHLNLGSASTRAARAALNDDANLRDLSTRSVIGREIEAMHNAYEWSAADVDWEVFGQAADGSAMVAHLDRSVSMETVRAGLKKLGYTEQGGVWNVGVAASSSGSVLASTLAAVALLPRQNLVVAADRESYVSTVLDAINRKQPSLLSVRAAADVAAPLVGTDSALLQTSSVSCDATSLKDKPAEVQAQGRAAVTRAGGLVDVALAGRGISEADNSQEMRFAMAFASPAQASGQLRVRTNLASGPFIGRTGRIEDSLVLTGSGVDGSVASLRFNYDPDTVAYMVGTGPLLFAGCPE